MNGQQLGRLKSDGKAMSWTEYHYMETVSIYNVKLIKPDSIAV